MKWLRRLFTRKKLRDKEMAVDFVAPVAEVWRYEVTIVLSDESLARMRSRRVEEIYKRLEPWGA